MFLAHLMLWGGLALMTQTLADEQSVELHRTRYTGVDAGLTFTELEHPQEDWQPCAPTEVEQASGFIPFTRPNDPASIAGIIPTIQWEALREGVQDYCYLYTLRNTIAYARRMVRGKKSAWAQRVRQAASEGEQTLARVEQMIPWPHTPRGLGLGEVNCTNADLQKARLELGDAIARVARALQGQ
jgi:hypothetical protein